MGQYTVVRGDTLSSIARKLGLSSYKELSGYRSGNPNLIYAGETLNYGGSGGSVPESAPATPAARTRQDYINEAQSIYGTPEAARIAAESIYAPLRAASESKLAAARAEAGQNFTDLSTRIKEAGVNQQKGLVNDLSQKGFLRSGEQIGVGEKIATETTAGLSRAETARTIADADAVLQNANFQVDINSKVQSRIDQLQQQTDARATELQTRAEERQAAAETAALNAKIASTSRVKVKAYKPITGFTATKNQVGGLSFSNNHKQPITAAQYAMNFSADGQSVDAGVIKQLLSQSQDAGDQKIIAEMDAGMSYDELLQKYPWVFGT